MNQKYGLNAISVLFFLIGSSLLIRLSSIGLSDLLVEEAYYWNYAMHLDWSYLDHPPLVALLIKSSTFLFGNQEWAVRIPSLVCWGIATFFSFQLTQLITRQGMYAIFFLSILPFFFLQSWVMTPDQPLLAAWSAALYFAYRACICDKPFDWYYFGIALGLGMLAKYTIVLLGGAVLLYLILDKQARSWFKRKEPYLSLLIIIALFSPVLYWNAKHEWASFAFQSTRRLQEHYTFSTHILLGWLILFLMPMGAEGLVTLYKKSDVLITKSSLLFLQLCTAIPICVFTLFSLTHPVKFNWIGPGLLAVIPWLSVRFQRFTPYWLAMGAVLLLGYSSMMFTIVTGNPQPIHRLFLTKYQNWESLAQQWLTIVSQVEKEFSTKPITISLDKYNIASELLFYQTKLLPMSGDHIILGSHIFGGESLMYRYWGNTEGLAGKYLILISDNIRHFDNPAIAQNTEVKTSIQSFQAVSQGVAVPIRTYYYQVVKMKY